MPLNSRGEKRRPTKCILPQKVIIPKGMINPEETTVIEIPARLHRQPVVVAKHKSLDIGQGLLCSPFKTENKDISGNNTNAAAIRENLRVRENLNSSNAGLEQQGQCSYQLTHSPLMGREEDHRHIPHVGSFKNLQVVEEKERSDLQRDLEVFQQARRKLIENASKLANQNPSTKILKL